jgi:hypothetical protein
MHPEILNKILTDLNGMSDSIEESSIITTSGVTIFSTFPSSIDENKVSALSAALAYLGNRSMNELFYGSFEHALVSGEQGVMLITPTEANTLLILLLKPEASLDDVWPHVQDAQRNAYIARNNGQ